ncbi:MAG: phosphoglucosamine mutase [Planctomycetota bacterium]|nr:phosphoglucosamine mutase [Planctomycetota bacterium]
MAERLFGTDGIRGIAGKGILSADSVRRLGAIIGATLGKGAARACVGRDTRPSGDGLSMALLEGLTGAGVDVVDLGIAPTPAVAHLVGPYECAAGVVISASHNPSDYNGLKVLGPSGEKIDDALEREIEERYLEDGPDPTAAHRGEVVQASDAARRYVSYLRGTWPEGSLDGMRIAVDCANGATGNVGPEILKELGADVRVTCADMSGAEINRNCGALYPENVQQLAREVEADVGISFDGDGDRLMMVDDTGQVRDGDDVLAVGARDLDRRGKLPGKGVVGTVMSNVGLDRSLEEIGAKLVRSGVGDRFVLAEMKKGGFALGGEPSGHVIFLPLSRAGDGILTALQVLRVIRESGERLSVLSRCLRKVPQVVLNVPVQDRRPLDQLEGVQGQIRLAAEKLGREGRVLVRYSGTEPLVRVMIEGPDRDAIRKMAQAIGDAFGR